MASKAIITRYSEEQITDAGFFRITAMTLVSDMAVPGKVQLYGITVDLNPASPATWTAAIKQAIVDVAVRPISETGLLWSFTDLTTASVFAPSYA